MLGPHTIQSAHNLRQVVVVFSRPLLAYGDTHFVLVALNPVTNLVGQVMALVATLAGVVMLVVWFVKNRRHRR
jgi:hypothetical protein